jgi:hypothetical protein
MLDMLTHAAAEMAAVKVQSVRDTAWPKTTMQLGLIHMTVSHSNRGT